MMVLLERLRILAVIILIVTAPFWFTGSAGAAILGVFVLLYLACNPVETNKP